MSSLTTIWYRKTMLKSGSFGVQTVAWRGYSGYSAVLHVGYSLAFASRRGRIARAICRIWQSATLLRPDSRMRCVWRAEKRSTPALNSVIFRLLHERPIEQSAMTLCHTMHTHYRLSKSHSSDACIAMHLASSRTRKSGISDCHTD